MAGRYVILEFEDRDAADAFVANENICEALGFRPIAMFLKPKAFCDCQDKSRQDNKNWRKHSKYGLYVCLKCKKPSKHHELGVEPRLQYVFGFNLLPEAK